MRTVTEFKAKLRRLPWSTVVSLLAIGLSAPSLPIGIERAIRATQAAQDLIGRATQG